MTPTPSSSLRPSPNPSLTPGECLDLLRQWATRAPAQAVLAATCLATFIYFYFVDPLFINHTTSISTWAQSSWNEENNSEHGFLVPFIFLGLIWYHRDRLRAAPKQGSGKGLWLLGFGMLLFILAARTLQPRVSLMALPFLLLGTIWFLWGRAVARILLFPCAFLVFMISSGFVEQATFQLQFVITSIVGTLSNLFGIHIRAIGTTLSAADDSFQFEIIGGCSGIRSLFAMAMLTAIYVHVFQRQLWKKVVIFAASLLFAMVGNIGRVFTIILVARFIGHDAAEFAHDYSGFIFFPIALGAMTGFAKLLNLHLPDKVAHPIAAVKAAEAKAKAERAPKDAPPGEDDETPKPRPTYDY